MKEALPVEFLPRGIIVSLQVRIVLVLDLQETASFTTNNDKMTVSV